MEQVDREVMNEISKFVAQRLEELHQPIPWVVAHFLLSMAASSVKSFPYEGLRVFVIPESKFKQFAEYLGSVAQGDEAVNYYGFTVFTVPYFGGDEYIVLVNGLLTPEEVKGLREEVFKRLMAR